MLMMMWNAIRKSLKMDMKMVKIRSLLKLPRANLYQTKHFLGFIFPTNEQLDG